VASPFSDDNGAAVALSEFVVGRYIISGSGTSPVLLEITNVVGNNVTFATAVNPLVAQDTFVTEYYLPNPDGFEQTTIVNFNGSTIVEIPLSSFATNVYLSAGYAAASGDVLPGDSAQAAIQKLDGVNDAQDTLLGTSQGALNLGAWIAPVTLLFSATSTVKALFQRIGELLMQLRGVEVTGITAVTTVDSVPHATVKCVTWLVEAFEEADPTRRKSRIISALTNGTLVDDTDFAKLNIGGNFNFNLSVDISGPDMRLRASSSTAGITVRARRIEVVKTVL